MSDITLSERVRGCLYGLHIGDALAMPVHWYYDTDALKRDYGEVTDYIDPKEPHPDSILWRSSYQAISEKGDILGDQAPFWGQRDIHYHRQLKAGENTLNLKLCRVEEEILAQKGFFDPEAFLNAYIDFMLHPERHRDTYVEEAHRGFFNHYARGIPPQDCGVEEKHIGGLCPVFPILCQYADDPMEGTERALERVSLTHPGDTMASATTFLCELFYEVVAGRNLFDLLGEWVLEKRHGFLGHPFAVLLDFDTRRVLCHEIGTACYVERALPAVVYLLLKYENDPEQALIENTMSGGDNCYRGAVLGAVLGLAHGSHGFPRKWREGLIEPPVMVGGSS